MPTRTKRLPNSQRSTGNSGTHTPLFFGVLSSYLGVALRRAQFEVFSEVARLLSHVDLTPGQFLVLAVIGENEGVRQIEICKELGMQKANLAPVIAILESRGVVIRGSRETAGRAHCLALSTAGKSLLKRALLLAESLEARLAAILGTPAAKTKMIRQLNQLANSIGGRNGFSSTKRRIKQHEWKEANIPSARR